MTLINQTMTLKEIRAQAKRLGIKMRHGRRGQPLEYVEFDRQMLSGVKYVAQRSGSFWYAYRVYPGVNGAVETLGGSNFFNAVDLALTACMLAQRSR